MLQPYQPLAPSLTQPAAHPRQMASGQPSTSSASSDHVRQRMTNTPRRDNPFELQVRKTLHARGLRYRVDKPLPGITRSRPDVVFPTEKIAVYLDGCFWHSCPTHGTLPITNREWWSSKLAANTERDRRHDRDLKSAGWLVARFWEHEDPPEIADAIEALIKARRAG